MTGILRTWFLSKLMIELPGASEDMLFSDGGGNTWLEPFTLEPVVFMALSAGHSNGFGSWFGAGCASLCLWVSL